MNSRTSINAINEQLSAFLDGELSQEELPLLLRQLEKNPELLSEAQRLQQTHLCVLGEQPVQPLLEANSLCKNIHDVIATEKVYDFSDAYETKPVTSAVAAVNSSLNSTSPINSNEPKRVAANDGFWKGFAGAGIAAAVAMLAINLWQTPTTLPIDNSTLSVESVSDEPAESYTVPKYVAPNQTDSTTFFLEPGDLQTVSLGNYRTEQQRLNSLDTFNVDFSEQLLNNRAVLLRMRQAENVSVQLSRENNRLRQQLESQAQILKAHGLTSAN